MNTKTVKHMHTMTNGSTGGMSVVGEIVDENHGDHGFTHVTEKECRDDLLKPASGSTFSLDLAPAGET
jgi:hypothetical protein